MTPRTEELLGKLALAGTFVLLTVQQLSLVIENFTAPVRPQYWQLGAILSLLGLFFVALIVLLTMRRVPAQSRATGWVPRADAIGGTFVLMLLLYLPQGAAPLAVQLIAVGLMIVGTFASIYCLHFLGRSFAVVAAARSLVTRGPYQLVRHPLYLAEGVTTLGLIIGQWSIAALGVGLIQMSLQFLRMLHEEQVLRAAFPEYADYAARVPMIVPGLTPAVAQ
jgi:protein-S-isoprenylcysteine O-methyltransferase Ste14